MSLRSRGWIGVALLLASAALFNLPSHAAGTLADPVVVIPPMKVGDKGAYDLTGAYPWVGESGTRRWYTFEVGASQLHVDADGRFRPSIRMDLAAFAPTRSGGQIVLHAHPRVEFVAMGDLSLVARVASEQDNHGLGATGSLWAQSNSSHWSMRFDDPQRWENGAWLPCGLLNLRQGREVAPTTLLPARMCELGGRQAVAMDKVEWRLIPDKPGFERFEAIPGPEVPARLLQLRFANKVPYPVEIVWKNVTGSGFRADLVAFKAGKELPVLLPEPEPMEPLTFAPARPWGPDDAGSGLEFPPSAAWQRGRDDPSGLKLREFVDGSGGRVVAALLRTVERQESQVSYQWDFMVSNGRAMFLACIPQVGPIRYADFGEVLWEPKALAESHLKYVGEYCGGWGLKPLDPSCIPESLPTVASMNLRWRYLSEPSSPQGLEFFGSCEWGVDLRVGLGRVRSLSVALNGTRPEQRESSRSDLLEFDGAGRMTAWEKYRNSVASVGPLIVNQNPTGGSGDTVLFSTPGTFAPATDWVKLLAVGGGTALLLLGLAVLLKGPLVSMFSRVERPAALEQRSRRRIMDAVGANPGVHLRQLVRITGLARGTVAHHLRKLILTEHLVAVAGRGYTCYFVADATVPLRSAAPILKAELARRILSLVRQEPGLSEAQLASRLNVTRQAVNHHARRLERAGGLVRGRSDGRARFYLVDAR